MRTRQSSDLNKQEYAAEVGNNEGPTWGGLTSSAKPVDPRVELTEVVDVQDDLPQKGSAEASTLWALCESSSSRLAAL